MQWFVGSEASSLIGDTARSCPQEQILTCPPMLWLVNEAMCRTIARANGFDESLQINGVRSDSYSDTSAVNNNRSYVRWTLRPSLAVNTHVYDNSIIIDM